MTLKLYEEALGGLSAGIFGTVIGYPLDLVKTRMQISSGGKGIIQIGASIVRKEGVKALYKGMGPPLVSLSILNTLNFSSYSYFRHVYCASKGWDVRNAIAGATGGPLAGSISTVEHMVKTQMQLDNVGLKQYRNSFHCVTSLLKYHGIQIMYTGHVVNTAREGLFLASYFYTYEGMRQVLAEDMHLSSKIAVPVAGGISGALAWFVSFPLDCIKAGIQGQNIPLISAGKGKAASGTRKKGIQVAKLLWETKGLRGLYSGVTPTLARAFLVSGSRFSAYEFALWCLDTTQAR